MPRPLRRLGVRIAWLAGIVSGGFVIGWAIVFLWEWTPMAVHDEALAARREVAVETAARIYADSVTTARIKAAEDAHNATISALADFATVLTEPASSPECKEAVRHLRRMRRFTLNP